MPEYSIRDLSDGGIRVRFPDSWTPSKGEGGKPGGGLRAAPFLFPYPLGGWLCGGLYEGCTHPVLGGGEAAESMGKRILAFSDSASSRP